MLSLIEMSFCGAVLILVILLLRAFAVNRLPKGMLCALWLTALLRLLLPFRLPSPTSIYTVPAALPRGAGLLAAAGPEGAAGEAAPVPVLWLLWLGGAVLFALYFLMTHLRGRKAYGASLPLEHSFARQWVESQGLRRPVRLRYSDQIDSPLTYGILWPVILLPKGINLEDEQALAFILAHETAHIRRFDALWKWLLAAALCVHWFNPLVWLMYLLSSRDLELASDEAVLRRCGAQAREAYALTLVRLEEARCSVSPLASGFNRQALRERITAIMRSPQTTALGVCAALFLVSLTVLVFATSAPKSEEISFANESLVRDVAIHDMRYSTADFETAVAQGTGHAETGYTEEQLAALMKALTFQDYETMSIAAFNRGVNAVFAKDESGDLRYVYELAASSLPGTDSRALFLRNTVGASLIEYQARMEEAYEGETVYPTLWGSADYTGVASSVGKGAKTWVSAQYSLQYRILDQDGLTVKERDAFLQAAVKLAQDSLAQQSNGSKESYGKALNALGAGISTEKIAFISFTVEHFEATEEY